MADGDAKGKVPLEYTGGREQEQNEQEHTCTAMEEEEEAEEDGDAPFGAGKEPLPKEGLMKVVAAAAVEAVAALALGWLLWTLGGDE